MELSEALARHSLIYVDDRVLPPVADAGNHPRIRRRAAGSPARTKARSAAVTLTTTGRSPSRPIRPCAAPSTASAWSGWRPRQATWPPR